MCFPGLHSLRMAMPGGIVSPIRLAGAQFEFAGQSLSGTAPAPAPCPGPVGRFAHLPASPALAQVLWGEERDVGQLRLGLLCTQAGDGTLADCVSSRPTAQAGTCLLADTLSSNFKQRMQGSTARNTMTPAVKDSHAHMSTEHQNLKDPPTIHTT